MSDINQLTNEIISFRDERDWGKFNNPKDNALSLVLEAAEVMEHFQWKNKEEIDEYVKANKNAIGKELADVMYWVLLIAHDLEIDIIEVSKQKLQENKVKYPVDKAKGTHAKYNSL